MSISDATKQSVAILLVPGSFSPPICYTHVSRALITSGYETVTTCPLLSSCQPSEQRQPPATLAADTFYIREVLQALLAKGKDVLILMNSYGGFPTTEALRDIPSRGSLASAGEGGAVVGLVYLSSFLPLPGDSLRNVMGDYLFEPLKTGAKGEYMVLPDGAGPGIFSDFAAEGRDAEVAEWFGKMDTHSSDSFDGEVTYDLWANFEGKTTYVIGERDVVVPPALAESMIEKVKAKHGTAIGVTRVEKGGHVMHVERPEAVVSAIEEVLASLS